MKTAKIISAGLILALLAVLVNLPKEEAKAAALTSVSDTLSRTAISPATAQHTIKFTTPTGVTAGQTIVINFTDAWTIPTTFAASDFSGTNITVVGVCSGASNNASFTSSNTAGSKNVTFTMCASNSIAAATAVTINIGISATKITNPATAGTYAITINGTMADSGSTSVVITGNDQVAVSGTVGQTISFSMATTTLSLGTLSTSAVQSNSHNFIFSTNGTSGMTVTVSGATLTSGGNTIAACATGCTSTTGTAQFGVNLVANTTPAVGAACSGTTPIGAAATNYSTANTFRFVTGETVASSTGAINNTTCVVSYIANIAGTTPAGTYSTTLTYVATANF